ncbi:MAG: hypothetical protein HC929_20205 [Leptolyngbyaceae cyanobacterium SM2_5_2]|nr:hypothetical protein [Leptolyngbyaceae cyanobacterium SM2_5_2]
MQSTIQQRLALGLATLSVGVLASPVALAQNTKTIIEGLREDQALIRKCRQLNRSLEVFDNTNLGPGANRIGTLAAGTQVTLTGVVAQGRAQVFLANGTLSSVQPVGWLSAAGLTTCGTTTPPPANQACFRANFDLNVRSRPTLNSTLVANYNTGDTVIAATNPPTQQTSPNSSPDFGRVWMAVSIFNGGTGWVARTGPNGQGSNLTAIRCP